MRILALDTSTGPASIALTKNGVLIAAHADGESMRQSQRLIAATDALVRAHGGYESLDAIAVTNGPGGFTGIRVALAAARGLALAANVPLVAVSTLETFAWQALHNGTEGEEAIAYVNAYRNQAYVQVFGRTATGLQPLCEAQAIDIPEAEAFCAPYEDAQLLGNLELPMARYVFHPAPQAQYTALYAEQLLASANAANRPAEAFYIRPPDAKPQKPLLSS